MHGNKTAWKLLLMKEELNLDLDLNFIWGFINKLDDASDSRAILKINKTLSGVLL